MKDRTSRLDLLLSLTSLALYVGPAAALAYCVRTSPALTELQLAKWTFYVMVSVAVGLSVSVLKEKYLSRKVVADEIVDRIVDRTFAVQDVERISDSVARVEELRQLFGGAQHSIFTAGTAMRHFSQDLDTVEDAINDGKDVRILMLDPQYLEANPTVAEQIAEVLQIKNLRDEVRSSFARICEFGRQVSKTDRLAEHLEFRVYSSIPTLGFTATDIGKETSKLSFDIFPYHCGVYDRPRFSVRPSSADGLYHNLLRYFEDLWNDSRSVDLT